MCWLQLGLLLGVLMQCNDSCLLTLLETVANRWHALQATIMGALGRMVGTIFALWLPLIPLFLVMRHALGGRSSMR